MLERPSSLGRCGGGTCVPVVPLQPHTRRWRIATALREARTLAQAADIGEQLPPGWGPQPASNEGRSSGVDGPAASPAGTTAPPQTSHAAAPSGGPSPPQKRRAVVVGGGWGGFGAALALAKAGAEVTLLDAAANPGGLSSAFVTPGARFGHVAACLCILARFCRLKLVLVFCICVHGCLICNSALARPAAARTTSSWHFPLSGFAGPCCSPAQQPPRMQPRASHLQPHQPSTTRPRPTRLCDPPQPPRPPQRRALQAAASWSRV
jgi:hypothetical protein